MEILDAARWRRPEQSKNQEIRETVAAMIAAIEAGGDDEIERISRRIDGFSPQLIELEPWRAYGLSEEHCRCLKHAAERIESFARLQRDMYRDLELGDDHGRFGHRIIPLERIAAYIPGGRFPLVSTALMTLIPARLAGVKERVAVSPGSHPALMAAASLAGATRFLRLGGAQAIASVALGCGWQESVDMVVGPGNAYVNAAKAQLQARVKIDTLAGPSEILILADESAPPSWLAMDILAQAEHDPQALSVLASASAGLLEDTAAVVDREVRSRPDLETGNIQWVRCRDRQELLDFANQMAPEHLYVAGKQDFLELDRLRHYGSLFTGYYSAVALGDYCAGPNHTLPTLGFARQKGGLQVGDFLKICTWQEVDETGYEGLAETAAKLAGLEGLCYHQKSLEIRMSQAQGEASGSER